MNFNAMKLMIKTFVSFKFYSSLLGWACILSFIPLPRRPLNINIHKHSRKTTDNNGNRTKLICYSFWARQNNFIHAKVEVDILSFFHNFISWKVKGWSKLLDNLVFTTVDRVIRGLIKFTLFMNRKRKLWLIYFPSKAKLKIFSFFCQHLINTVANNYFPFYFYLLSQFPLSVHIIDYQTWLTSSIMGRFTMSDRYLVNNVTDSPNQSSC